MVDRKHYSDISIDYFSKSYADKKPLIIEGLIDNWEFKTYKLETLDENFGEKDIIIRKSEGKDINKPYQIKMSKYIQMIEKGNKDKWYCDWPYYSMGNKEISLLYNVPAYFSEKTINHGYKIDDKFKWIFIGSKGTGTHLHQDFKQTHNWHGIIFGCKEWLLISPDHYNEIKKEGIEISDELLADAYYKNLIQKTLLQPGEILYTPRNWWHSVKNLENTFSISENFWYESEIS
ncbi:cupin-like domain-containing protein [Paenibacillus sp. GCM10012307]|uniref:Cupin-like domain-containing protein n=1 Tax=Paenibacillus roseus TaxID=2798579 RepID=A0A934JAD0_9BACL|nr:cupin-like domain-containing protein [Paenibacillus roseus]MBJ6363200.1 cupin-like domain-containing protein [Paenibacillus roseus]